MSNYLRLGFLVSSLVIAGCAARRPPIQTVPHVDLPRFMGDWYVIANIPTFVEKDAYNAVESYRLDADGTIATTFTFRKGGFDGEVKRYQPRGVVYDAQSNAVWGMQFIWPFKGDFRIVYLNADYTYAVIGREKRDYVWIMARQPNIPDADYQRISEMLAREGYDTTLIQKVPQRWESAQPATWGMRSMDIEQLSTDPRVTVRRSGQPVHDGTAVVYWMQRAQRALDNPALETAIAAANALGKPVVVYFALIAGATGANLRHYHFMVEGLHDVAEDIARRGIGFAVRRSPDHDVLRFCDEVQPALVIGDENPLRRAEQAKQRIAAALRVPFWTVDADVIVPSRLLRKEQYAARTIRPRIHAKLPMFLRPIRRHAPSHTWTPPRGLQTLPPDLSLLDGFPIDRSVSPVTAYRGGGNAARQVLRRFVAERLTGYAQHRNHPERDATSRLSPYLHFGHIGPHTVALAVRASDAPTGDRDAFLEELIVRRELAVNFVRYNSAYDGLGSAEPWARRTLAAHRSDPRPHRYTPRHLEQAETHDGLWNAAQRQMVRSGWMHGYLRMYWAKKILEWSESPATAYEIAVGLNDRYELDGRDPSGYAGIAWAIAGKHDRAWGPERPIYGTVRYMSYASTSRKFDSVAYIRRVQALAAETRT